MTEDSTAAPSPAETSDATVSAPADTSVNAGTQAPASPGDNRASTPDAPVDDRSALLAAVQDVVKAKPKNPEGEGKQAAPELASPTTDPNKPDQPAADPLEADPTEAELAAQAPKTRQRIEKLLAERNAVRAEIAALQPAVAKWNQMEGYLKRHDLAAEDVNLLLGVGAALRRGDFKAFRDGVLPYVQLAEQALGLSLPPDLNAKVEAGELTAEAAKELSVARIANARLQGEAKARTNQDTARRTADEQARVSNEVQGAVTAWEADVKGRDPDYARKASAVLRITQAIIAEKGRPRTAAEAVGLAKSAYEEATRMFAAARPAPVPTLPQPNGAAAVNTDARPAPKTMMEAALLGLQKSRRA